MKVGLIYTSTTPELIELVEREVRAQLGDDVVIMSYQDPDILGQTRECGYVPAPAAARLVSMYMQAIHDGADALLNICSSVGEVADASQDLARYIGVPLVRIDEDMCRQAILAGSRIAVLATLPTTLEPTKNTLKRLSRELGRPITLVDGLIDGAFGLNQEQFRQMILAQATALAPSVDVILFCQGSMAYCEEYIAEQCHLPVFSSPRFGAVALKQSLIRKGVLSC